MKVKQPFWVRVKGFVGDLLGIRFRVKRFSDATAIYMDCQRFVGGTRRLFAIPNAESEAPNERSE